MSSRGSVKRAHAGRSRIGVAAAGGGALLVLMLAAAPTFASARFSFDSHRTTLMAELVGADADEATELEDMLDGDNDVDEVDATKTETSETDEAADDDQGEQHV